MSDDKPLTLNDAAVAMHEFYRSARHGGFDRWAALWLTACWFKGVPLPDWFADHLKSIEPDDSP